MHGLRSGYWPLYAAFTCLFTLAVTTSWWWPVCYDLPCSAPTSALEQAVESIPRQASVEEGDISAERTGSVVGTNEDSTTVEISALRRFAAPRRMMRILPPVADRIVLDPSLAETPSLPAMLDGPADEPPDVTVSRADSQAEVAVKPHSPSIVRERTAPTPGLASVWPWPEALVYQLNGLTGSDITEAWATETLLQLRLLHEIDLFSDPRAGEHLDALLRLQQKASTLAAQIPGANDRARLLRVAFGLERRLALWRPIHRLAEPTLVKLSSNTDSPTDVADLLNKIEQDLGPLENTNQWHSYLLLDQLKPVLSRPWEASAEQRSQLARAILRRMVAPSLSQAQQAWFKRSPWFEFAAALRQWVSEPVDYQTLLDDLEHVETNWDEQTVRRIANQYQVLRWSPVTDASQLASWMNSYYRNANVRVAVSSELVNRLLPELPQQDEPVDQMLLGSRILGRSRVSTRLRVVLVPDEQRWRLGLEAQGQVDSKTSTEKGPARFFNDGRAHYLARKLLLIDRLGFRVHRAEAEATSEADLTGMETNLDRVPLLNVLARSIAKQQYDNQSHRAKWQLKDMIATRAQSRLDEEVDRQVTTMRAKFHDRVYQPLEQLGLEPETVDLRTTHERLIARYRVAGEDQLAAFTPRPQAPANTLLSVQLHESAFNNAVAALRLNRKGWNLRDLFHEVAGQLQLENYQVPDEVPENVIIQLAKHEPIHLRFSEDRVHVRLRITRLTAERRTWRNLEVNATYGPEVNGLQGRLVRDGYIRLKARRLSFGDQLALRGIFSKVLPDKPDLDAMNSALAENPRLRDLQISQFVMRDGWIGLAVTATGPARLPFAALPHVMR